jgi:predicted permease
MLEWNDEIRKQLASLKLEPAREAEIVEELAQHLEDRCRELLSGGASEDEARRAALAELSESDVLAQELKRVEQQVEHEPVVLGARRINMIADLWQDVRFASRSLRKNTLLSVVVITTLTLGIGVSAGVFAYYNADVLRPRIDKDFDSFAGVYSAYSQDPTRLGYPGETTLEDYLAYRGAKSLRNLAASAGFSASLGHDDPVGVHCDLVTSNFFSLYGVEQPLVGRLLQPEDYAAASPVVVLSEWLWRNRFAADPTVVGKIVHINGQPVTVVGVAPKFAGGARAFFPYTLATYLKASDNLLRPGEAAWLGVAGRLNPGFSHEEAEAELQLLASQQDHLHPGRTTTIIATNGSAFEHPTGTNREDHRLVFVVLLGTLIFIVLIVCVNVTTLLLSRAVARRQEIAVRLALGASKLRLSRMLLVETFLLAGLAGLAGFYLTYEVPGMLDHWLENRVEEIGWSLAPDWRVFVFLTLVTVLAGTMAGLQPALQSLKVNLSEMLKGRQSMSGGPRGARFYGLLIGVQVALSFFLLYGAMLFVSAARQAASFDPGFETRQVLWTGLTMQSRAREPRNWEAFYRTLTERISALPGVQSVAYGFPFPFRGSNRIDLQSAGQALRQVDIKEVSPNYFTTLGIPIVSGRAFREGDPLCGQAVCSVVGSQQLAREFWPGENPLGQTLQDGAGNSYEVVGIARDISSTNIGGDHPTIYQPLNLNGTEPASLFVRFSGDEAALTRAIMGAVRELAPELSLEARTVHSVREETIERLWRYTQLIVLLCAMAILLAVMGIYGVVAFAVSRRTKELGIRIAFGAQKKDIYRAVLGSSGRPVVIGLLIGLALTVVAFSAVAPLTRTAVFTLNAQNPISYALTAMLLAGAAISAMLIPARRATKVDPLVALRYE